MPAAYRAQRHSPRSKSEFVDRLLLCVARRADELARIRPTGGSARRDRETWQRAELECLPDLAPAFRDAERSTLPRSAV